jgi:uncharacterized protein YcfL
MKQKIVLILAVMIAMLMLVGCAAKTDEPKNTLEPTVEATIKPTLTRTEEPMPSQSIEPISSATIKIDENNSIDIALQMIDGETKGFATVKFDGKDSLTEYEYLMAITLFFDELKIDYSTIGMSGQDAIMVESIDGELTAYLPIPEKYKTVKIDNAQTIEYRNNILEVMKK